MNRVFIVVAKDDPSTGHVNEHSLKGGGWKPPYGSSIGSAKHLRPALSDQGLQGNQMRNLVFKGIVLLVTGGIFHGDKELAFGFQNYLL